MAIAKSFDVIPMGIWGVSESFIDYLNKVFSGVFSTGLRLALPIMGVLFLAKMTMAIITRTMPQMNIFVIGFPVQIAVGLIGLAISLPLTIKVMRSLLIIMRDNIWFILR
jgi:flagellar biosynthetic protein FliR